MRISDWSSDVCSSDLSTAPQGRHGEIPAFAGMTNREGSGAVRLQSVLNAERVGGKPLGRRERDRGRTDGRQSVRVKREEAGALHEVGDRQPARKARAAAGGQAMVGPGAIIADRSEEHTADLQSLMRISYAVFCLKKKKT